MVRILPRVKCQLLTGLIELNGRRYPMSKPMFDSTGSLIEDEGEKILVEDKWIKVKPVKKEKYVKSIEFWRDRQ